MSGAEQFAGRAAQEVVDLHVLLQAWFRDEAGADAASVLAHFDDAFAMVTPTGRLVTFAQFSAGFPALRGSRPGLVMAISDVAVRYQAADSALVTYCERQTQDGAVTDRLSTALLVGRPDRPTPVWRHLQETWKG